MRLLAVTFVTLGLAYGVWYSYAVFLVALLNEWMLHLANAIGGSSGPWVAGLIFDATGSYAAAFVAALACGAIATTALWIAAPRRLRRGRVGR